MSTTLLIDGDPVAHRAGLLAARTAGTKAAAVSIACRKVERWLDAVVGGERAVVCFSCRRDDCFRRQIDPTYKANRKGLDKRVQSLIDAARDGLRAQYEAKQLPRLEADDVLGILATGPWIGGDRIVVADDKDMLQIPGVHSRPYTKGGPSAAVMLERAIQEVSAEEAEINHLLQTLTGDRADAYRGCRGIGEVRAKALLAATPAARAWPIVVRAFRSTGKTEEDALRQARLARILRADDYDLETRTVRPWHPPPPVSHGPAAAVAMALPADVVRQPDHPSYAAARSN